MVDYASLFSSNLPRSVATPPGASDTVRYIFSITNAVPEVVDADEYLSAPVWKPTVPHPWPATRLRVDTSV